MLSMGGLDASFCAEAQNYSKGDQSFCYTDKMVGLGLDSFWGRYIAFKVGLRTGLG